MSAILMDRKEVLFPLLNRNAEQHLSLVLTPAQPNYEVLGGTACSLWTCSRSSQLMLEIPSRNYRNNSAKDYKQPDRNVAVFLFVRPGHGLVTFRRTCARETSASSRLRSNTVGLQNPLDPDASNRFGLTKSVDRTASPMTVP